MTGQASGGGTVRVFSGTDYAMLLSQTPFGAGYSGGVNVAAGDVDGDGRVELVVAQASGGLVAVMSGVTHAVTASGAPRATCRPACSSLPPTSTAMAGRT